ncbi:STAS domain-containing protein [Actinomadura hibisca]|uniref:STAS domain-containing protein n=1 Tax=Actinomadura hibisca TaxID=68565 RepID=UPI000A0580A9|nr:STAS domain-containing protein [Actinomadura hibisca]
MERTSRPPADLTQERFPGHTLVTLRGEIDIASAPDLRERLRAVLGTAGPRVVIDLSGVDFCDVSGLALLVEARRQAGSLGTDLTLSAPRPQLARLLKVTGLDRAFTVRHLTPCTVAA